MSSFVNAMDRVAPAALNFNKRVGENGAPEYTAEGVEDPRVALFFALVRGIKRNRVSRLMDRALSLEKPDVVADVFVMAFQTRNCRGGKGERELFYWMILHLFGSYPSTVKELIKIVPEYGSYNDWFTLASIAMQDDASLPPLVASIHDSAAEQLRSDGEAMKSKKNSVSLLAKWAPREKRSYHSQAKMLATKLFPGSAAPLKDYRQLVASLNSTLGTTELRMCANEWDVINFGAVPSRAMLKYRKAFLNEKVGSIPTSTEEETGNRFPENEVRVATRERLRRVITEQRVTKLKGKQLFPHEIVNKLLDIYGHQSNKVSVLEADLMQQQWNDIRHDVQEAMRKFEDTEHSAKAVNLGNLVAIADVSGSMYGTPLEVAVALSILVSELAAPAFANRILTFSATPTWIKFKEGIGLREKVRITSRADWGMNTDFASTMDLIMQTAVKANLKPEDIPDLIVFSDMQFDAARSTKGSWETLYEQLLRKYEEAGVKTCGEPWKPPRIIFWNLRGDTRGFPAQADTEGVTMLSGFSPSLMKLFLSGGDLEQEEELKEVINAEGEVVIVKEKVKQTPYDTLRVALDDKVYDKVREVLGRSREGVLEDYGFEPTVEDDWVLET